MLENGEHVRFDLGEGYQQVVARELVLGTAGHIDHGKTALVRALTGVDTDRLPEEKRRGITIDLGFAQLDLGDGVRLGLVDVPGHERFIRNMLAGASGIDLALLVIAADDSVMPQTREHLEVLRLLDVPAGVIALSKCDLGEPDWLDLVEADVRALVAGTFLEAAPIVRTSTTTGMGIDALKAALKQLVNEAPARSDPGLFRLAVDRSFTLAGYGTVVTGTVSSGSVAVGDEVEWWPEGRVVRVRGLHQHGQPAERLVRGARAALNLVGVHHTEIARGQELSSPGYLHATRMLTATVRGSEDAPRPVKHRGRYRLHIGTADVAVSLSLRSGSEIEPGSEALAQLFCASPVMAVHGQPFVLRAESPPATLGGGHVLEPTARRLRRRDRTGWERAERRGSKAPLDRLRTTLAVSGLNSNTDADLVREISASIGEVPALVAELVGRGEIVELPVGPRRVVRLSNEVVADLEDRFLRALGRLHARYPRQTAVRRSSVSAMMTDLPGEAFLAALIDRLAKRGAITADARTIARADHKPKLTQAERALMRDLHEAVRAGGFSPPDRTELARKAGARAAAVPDLLDLLREEGRIVEIGSDFVLDTDFEADLRRRVTERLAGGGTMSMADLRDLLGTSRKFAVPIGEYLDRIGLTSREGDLRRLAVTPEASEVPT